MARSTGRTAERQEGSWRPNDAELGSIIENRVDEAYMLSWPGPLEIWVPVHDTGGYDRIRAPLGSYDFRLDQIKGTSSLHSGNQLRCTFYLPASFYPRPNFHITFLYYSLEARGPVDPAFKLPSEDLLKVCHRVPGRGRDLYEFVANRSAFARDAAAKYQIGLHELAGSCGWSVLPPTAHTNDNWLASRRAAVSSHPVETNAFFKRAFDASFLEVATGDEMLMAAQPDVFGRHRLVFSKSTGGWISLSIHGGTRTGATDLIQANIHRASFVPHPRHFVLIEHYDEPKHNWYPYAWLIRSTDFARLARGKGAYLLFTTTLNPDHVGRWSPFRIPTSTVAGAVLDALHGPMLKKAA